MKTDMNEIKRMIMDELSEDELYEEMLGADSMIADDEIFVGGVRVVRIFIILDTSGSMRAHGKRPEEALRKMLEALAEKNRVSVDFQYMVCFATFNRSTQFVPGMETPISPEEALKVLDKRRTVGKDPFECGGVTNIGRAVDFVNNEFRTGKAMTSHCHKNDPKSFLILMTDYEGTDDDIERESSIDKLLHNKYYMKTNECICIYTPSKVLMRKADQPELERDRLAQIESNKDALAMLTGSRDNVLMLDDNIMEHLGDFLIEGTVTATDATRADAEQDGKKKSAADVMRETQEREKEAQESLKDLSSATGTITEDILRELRWQKGQFA